MTTKKIIINIIQTSNDSKTQKKMQIDQQTQLKQEILKPQVSSFNDNQSLKIEDWKEYNEKQLLKVKQLYPNSIHNELTSQISKKQKKQKKNVKYFDQLAQYIKNEYNNKQIEQIINQDDNLQILQKNKESDQIIEKIRSSSLKLIFDNKMFELKGQTILDAINENQLLIYINHEQKDQDTKNEETYKCSQCINDQQIYDDDENDNIKIVNVIKNYL